ncbi:MAG TPA: hypothetical protein VKE69_06005 [Planctomycetota bacterium]|nr:hypothetical protein [Planctomycetota bacterium]
MNRAVVAAGLVLAAVSCRSTAAHKQFVDETDWSYPTLAWNATRDVFHDLLDIAYVNGGVGDGLLIDVQPTKLLHVGLGWADTVRGGMRPRAFGMWSQRQAEYGLSIFYWRDIHRQAVFGTETLFDQSTSYKGFDLDHQNETGHWMDFSFAFHPFLLGWEASVSPKEALDFTASLLRWVVTIVPIRSGLHAIGVSELGWSPRFIDESSDDTDSARREKGGTPAGAVYQGDTPFFEHERTVRNREEIVPAYEPKP